MKRKTCRMRDRPPSKGSGAFTIVELLVVVATLSVLMAILLPALGRARAATRRVVCLYNVKNIALGYMGYLGDNNGRFYDDPNASPNCTFGGWSGTQNPAPFRPINSYLSLRVLNAGESEARVFRCPADSNALDTVDGSKYKDLGSSYQANFFLVGPRHFLRSDLDAPWGTINQRIRACGNVRQSNVFQPQRMAWIGDFYWTVQWDPISTRCTGWHGRRHRHCIAFLDGHAEFTEIMRGIYDDAAYRMQPHQKADETIRQLQYRVKCKCEK